MLAWQDKFWLTENWWFQHYIIIREIHPPFIILYMSFVSSVGSIPEFWGTITYICRFQSIGHSNARGTPAGRQFWLILDSKPELWSNIADCETAIVSQTPLILPIKFSNWFCLNDLWISWPVLARMGFPTQLCLLVASQNVLIYISRTNLMLPGYAWQICSINGCGNLKTKRHYSVSNILIISTDERNSTPV